MAIKVVTKKKVPQPKVELTADGAVDEAFRDKVDEFAKCYLKHKKLKEELDALRSEVEGALCEGLAPEATAEVATDKFVVSVSSKGTKRVINDMKAVAEALGDTFIEVATVPMKALDDYLTPEERAEVVDESQNGSRRLKVSKK